MVSVFWFFKKEEGLKDGFIHGYEFFGKVKLRIAGSNFRMKFSLAYSFELKNLGALAGVFFTYLSNHLSTKAFKSKNSIRESIFPERGWKRLGIWPRFADHPMI